VLEEKTKGSLKPLAEDKIDWACTMSFSLLLELEAAMVFLFFVAGFSLCSTSLSAAFLHAERGGAKKVAKLSSKLLNKLQLMLQLSLSVASVRLESIVLRLSLLR
jgi:hypothetical protein